MNKNSTILELRWGGKHPRIIYEDSASILFYILGDGGTDLAIWQEKEGLKDFYYEDYDRYHGSSWKPYFESDLCEWCQNVTYALEKNGVNKHIMYIVSREIFSLKEDPTNEETIEKIFAILRKYFENVSGNFNRKVWNKEKPRDPVYDLVYRYEGIKDLISLFLTGYAFHYANTIRYKPNDQLFNAYRTLKYKDMFYRTINCCITGINKEQCKDIPRMHDRHYQKIESIEQAMVRIRDLVIGSETGIEEILTKNCVTVGRINLSKETINKITEEKDKEIQQNQKNICKEPLTLDYEYEQNIEKANSEMVKEKER